MSNAKQLPSGFIAHTGRCGLREEEGDDVTVIFSQRPCASAGMFTLSRFAGPSVEVSKPRAASGHARALVVVAKNANVATGATGRRNAEELTDLVAKFLGIPSEEVLVASTGVIGRQYPMEKLRSHLGALRLPEFDRDAPSVAKAMMTTDTVPKWAQRQVGAARIVGVAKGVGMIEPNMATMLAFVFTDAEIAPDALDRIWRRVVDETFNCLSIDTDTSTSDSAVVLANGVAGPVDHGQLASALREVCLDLTLQLARDGEGATKLLTVTVRSAESREQAKTVAKSILNSPLVKTAVHGADPNWGRVAMAVGKCDYDSIDPELVVIRFGDLELYPTDAGEEGLEELKRIMAEDHVEIEVDLNIGSAEATVWGCDLSDGYVRINADYTT